MNSKCKGGPLQHIQLIARYFNQEITVYEVTDESVFVLCGQLIPEEEEEEKISTNDHRYSQRARFYYHRPRKAAKIYGVRTVGQDSHNHISFYTMLQGAQTDKQK